MSIWWVLWSEIVARSSSITYCGLSSTSLAHCAMFLCASVLDFDTLPDWWDCTGRPPRVFMSISLRRCIVRDFWEIGRYIFGLQHFVFDGLVLPDKRPPSSTLLDSNKAPITLRVCLHCMTLRASFVLNRMLSALFGRVHCVSRNNVVRFSSACH